MEEILPAGNQVPCSLNIMQVVLYSSKAQACLNMNMQQSLPMCIVPAP